jgi:hypothetical protein
MTLILDAGALLAIERRDRMLLLALQDETDARRAARTHGGVVGQVWRGGGSRQALVSKALHAIDVRPLDRALGRSAGELLARTRGRDVVDAALVLLANSGDTIVTSDPDDIATLVAALRRDISIVTV